MLANTLFLATFASSLFTSSAAEVLKRDEEPALPHDPNTTKHCTWWYENDGSVSCEDMPATWAISLDDFRRWNPSITADCGNFETEKSYCVEAFGEPEPVPTSTREPTTSKPSPTSPGAPGPTQPGTVETCNRWDFVDENNDCTTFIKKYPGLTLADLKKWNTGIGDQCQFLWGGVYVCTSVPGWTPTTPSGTKASSTAPSPTNGIETPSPIQPGMVGNCNKFHFVKDGDICSTIAQKNSISLSQFYKWNPKVGNDCGGLWLEVYVCVNVIGNTPAITTAKSSTTVKPTPTNGVATPTPIQPGMVNNCNKFHFVKDGDICSTIAQKNSISLSQFYQWNPKVGSDCGGLWLEVYVCVNVIGNTPATTTKAPPTTTTKPPSNGITTPTPIQSGMVGNCNRFHFVQKGDLCASIAQRYGASLSQFYKWNPAVGSTCGALWLETYVCVGTVGVTPTTLKTTANPTKTQGNGVATPTPFQAGMASNCKKFHFVKKGDNCSSIAKNAGVSLSNFYRWNAGVGSDCRSLWLDNYVCIGLL